MKLRRSCLCRGTSPFSLSHALLLGWLVVAVGCGAETDVTRVTAIAFDSTLAPSAPDPGSTATTPEGPADDGRGNAELSAMAPGATENGEGGGSSDAFARTFFGLPTAFERRRDAPEWLSQMGVSSSGARVDEEALGEALLRAAPSLFAYDVQTPLWSDGAHKRRWLALPEAERIGFAEHGPWAFPRGTVLVKHFEMALDERQPDERRLLETRFLVAASDGSYYGLSYKWNTDGTDAELLRQAQTEEFEITGADGVVRRQKYYYPGPGDCLSCHNPPAGYVLGFRTAQLNGSRLDAASGREENQLVSLEARGWLDRTLEPELSGYPRLTALNDMSSSLYDRVRSYWDSNCSMCHGARTDIQARWDARFETPLAERGLIEEPPFVGLGNGRSLIEPSDADDSVLYQRVAVTLAGFRMPPLGRNRIDERFVELLRAWIESLPAATEP